jgi:glycosyltransferase involved in cell wall biosynthesis
MVHDLMVLDKDLEFDPGFRISASITWPISIRFADIIVTPSEWTRTQLVSRWPRAEEKIVVVPYPSRLKARAGKPKQWDAHRRPTILMVSSTDPHKDHVRGIEVVQMARKISGIDFALAIIGPRGRAERKVEEWTNLCDPTQTWISRYVGLNDEQLTRHLDDGFALLNTSKAEGFGLPLLEAAARDLPVVHSRVASLNEVIDLGSDGFVTSLYLAYELTALLDAASYEAAVQRGREAVKAYSFERFADDLVSLIGRT